MRLSPRGGPRVEILTEGVIRAGRGAMSAPMVVVRAAVAATTVLVLLLAAGCTVGPLPKTLATGAQSPREQDWDMKDCLAEAGYQTGYSPEHSPLLNWFQRLFFWSTAGAATGFGVMTVAAGAGAAVTGPTFISSPIGEAVVAGAGAGAITGTVLGWSGQPRFERAWIACMEARGYTIVRAGEHEQARRAMPP
jgi:hypothetical protein